MNKVLILDVGGIILPNYLGSVWDKICSYSGVTASEIASFWRENLREDFWHGNITIPDFWDQLAQQYHLTETQIESLEDLIQAKLHNPLPAYSRLKEWSAKAQIILITNNRHEWIRPCLEDICQELGMGLSISSENRCIKPHNKCFQNLIDQYTITSGVYYIDDSRENIRKARHNFGWDVCYGDTKGLWIQSVDIWL